jgi:hypothetical protein
MLSSPSRKRFVLMDVTFFELQPYFSSTHTSLQGESPSEEKSSMSNPLPVPAPMPEHDKQQFHLLMSLLLMSRVSHCQ